jgi:hypothetical protein
MQDRPAYAGPKLGIAVELNSGPIASLVQRECDRSRPKIYGRNSERTLVRCGDDISGVGEFQRSFKVLLDLRQRLAGEFLEIGIRTALDLVSK